MKRTTIFLDDVLLRRAKQIARSEGKSFAQVVREAVANYVAGGRSLVGKLPSVAGQFESGAADTAARVDEFLWRDPHS